VAKLQLPDGEFEIRPTRYQYATVTAGSWDADWVEVFVRCEVRGRSFEVADAMFQSYELRVLSDWLVSLGAGILGPIPEFIEGDLSILRGLSHESECELSVAIAGVGKDGQPQSEQFDLRASPDALRSFGLKVRAEADRFPLR
jgi:hypothetical protein